MTESAYPNFPVILIDDEDQALKSFEMALRSANMNNFISCHDSRDVMPLLQSRDVEVMLLDLRMPHISGEELLPKIISNYPEVPVIVVTGANDVETAVKCMQHGAFDYIVKPIEKSRSKKAGWCPRPAGRSNFVNCSARTGCSKLMYCPISWKILKLLLKSSPTAMPCDPSFNTLKP
jgi:CheY-like chemotaxis protein